VGSAASQYTGRSDFSRDGFSQGKPRSRLKPLLPGFRQPNGWSIDGLCGVSSSAPSAVMCRMSSRRTPNLSGM